MTGLLADRHIHTLTYSVFEIGAYMTSYTTEVVQTLLLVLKLEKKSLKKEAVCLSWRRFNQL